MTKKLITRSHFAKLCGVTPSSVTQVADTLLKAAKIGKHIDLNHPAAREYLERQTRESPDALGPAIDPYYTDAVEFCQKTGRYSISAIQREFRIGYNRARAIMDIMTVADLVPAPGEPPPKIAPYAKPKPPPQPKKPPRATDPPPESAAADEKDEEIFEIPADLAKFADHTIREILERFGTEDRFNSFLSAVQKIEGINEKRLKNAEKEGKLVNREMVKTAVIDRIDAVFVRMLTDGAKTIAARAHSITQAGEDVNAVRLMVEDQLGSFIRPAKTKMHKALKNEEN